MTTHVANRELGELGCRWFCRPLAMLVAWRANRDRTTRVFRVERRGWRWAIVAYQAPERVGALAGQERNDG